jgi:hypothetical protein
MIVDRYEDLLNVQQVFCLNSQGLQAVEDKST